MGQKNDLKAVKWSVYLPKKQNYVLQGHRWL